MEEKATGPASGQPDDRSAIVKALVNAFDKAISIPDPAIDAYVRRLRAWSRKQDRSGETIDRGPAWAVKAAEKQYLAAVASMGAGSGAAAAAPGVGTGVSLALMGGELAANLGATALYILAIAKIHGLDASDIERRRTLLYVALLGQAAPEVVEKAVGRTGPYWAKAIIKNLDREAIAAVNRVLGPRFVTLYGTRQGVIVLGRVIPFGIGAGVGAAANIAVGLAVVGGVRRAFPPAPSVWRDSQLG